MKTEVGAFTRSGTGNATVILNTPNLTPKVVIFWIASYGSSDTISRGNLGFMAETGEGGISWFADATSARGAQTNASKTLSHQNRNSGTLTEVIAATKVSFDLEEFTLNFTAATNSAQIGFLAIGD